MCMCGVRVRETETERIHAVKKSSWEVGRSGKEVRGGARSVV